MIKSVIITVLLMCISLFCQGQTNRALFVAIDKYPPESGWNDIHSTNDAKIVIPMLEHTGFRKNNIISLINEKATKAAIVKELTNLCNRSGKGDCIYIHFSCHGQQMIDDNGDEEDELDEALIPYDAKRRFSAGIYEGQNHLRDDELELYLNKIRVKIGTGGSVTLVLDACHSGTANRSTDDDMYVRGTTYIFAPHDFIPTTRKPHKNMTKLEARSGLGSMNVFSACQPDQLNYEYFCPEDRLYYGALSYAFCNIVNGKDFNLSAIQFQNEVEKQVENMFISKKIKQTPSLETTDENKRFKIGR